MTESGYREKSGQQSRARSCAGRFARPEEQTYYEILDVAPDADMDGIRAAYRRLARLHHPDAGGSDEMFKRIGAAYGLLSRPHLRAEYDQWLRSGRPKAVPVAPDVPPAPSVRVADIVAVMVSLAAPSHYIYVLFFAKMNTLERLAAAMILPPLYCIAIGIIIYLTQTWFSRER